MRRAGRPPLALCVAAVLLLVAPLALVPIPPLYDYPGHLARYAVQLDNGPVPIPPAYFTILWRPIANLGVDLIVQALGQIAPLFTAGKIAVMLVAATLAGSVCFVSRTVSRSALPTLPWALMMVYSKSFLFGLLNYWLGVGLCLIVFALAIRWQDRPRRRATLLAGGALAILFVHAVAWVILVLLLGARELGVLLDRNVRAARPALRRLLAVGLPLLPSAIAFLAVTPFGTGESRAPQEPWVDKFYALVDLLRDQSKPLDIASAAACALLIAAGMVVAHRRALSWETLLPLAALALLFLVTPDQVNGSASADERLLPVLYLLGLCSLDWSALPRAGAVVLVAGSALLLVRTAVTSRAFLGYARSYDAQLRALDHVPRGARIVTFYRIPCRGDGWANPRLASISTLAVPLRGAWVNSMFALSSGQLLRVNYAPAPGLVAKPSDAVFGTRCAPRGASIADRVAALPGRGIDFVWLLGFGESERPAARLGTPLWRSGAGALYRWPAHG